MNLHAAWACAWNRSCTEPTAWYVETDDSRVAACDGHVAGVAARLPGATMRRIPSADLPNYPDGGTDRDR